MIFCVEDDNNIRDLLVYTLETTGFHARGLENSQELWKALAEEEPELILLILCFLERTDIPFWKN